MPAIPHPDTTLQYYNLLRFFVYNFVFNFSLFFVSVPCARLSCPFCQLLSARKYIVSYRIVQLYYDFQFRATVL